MSLDIINAKEAWLGAKTNFEAWRSNFEMNYQKPMLEMTLNKVTQELPPEVIEKLKEMDASGFQKIEEQYGGSNVPRV